MNTTSILWSSARAASPRGRSCESKPVREADSLQRAVATVRREAIFSRRSQRPAAPHSGWSQITSSSFKRKNNGKTKHAEQHPNSNEKPAQAGKSWSEEQAGNVKDTSTAHRDTGAQRSLLIMLEKEATSSRPQEHRQPATSCIWSQEGWGCFRLKGHCRPQNNPPTPTHPGDRLQTSMRRV